MNPSRIPQRISKNIFVLGSYEYLKRLEGKVRKCLFFYVKIFKNNSVGWQKVNIFEVPTHLLHTVILEYFNIKE
jgi:hypothetical protein